MNKEQLERAKEIRKEIDKLSKLVLPVNAILEECGKLNSIRLEIQVISIEGSYENTVLSKGNTEISKELNEVITDELSVAFERITRSFEKKIKKLEKEFESL